MTRIRKSMTRQRAKNRPKNVTPEVACTQALPASTAAQALAGKPVTTTQGNVEFVAGYRVVVENCVKRLIETAVYRILPTYSREFSAEKIELAKAAAPYTLTSPERIYSFIHAVE